MNARRYEQMLEHASAFLGKSGMELPVGTTANGRAVLMLGEGDIETLYRANLADDVGRMNFGFMEGLGAKPELPPMIDETQGDVAGGQTEKPINAGDGVYYFGDKAGQKYAIDAINKVRRLNGTHEKAVPTGGLRNESTPDGNQAKLPKPVQPPQAQPVVSTPPPAQTGPKDGDTRYVEKNGVYYKQTWGGGATGGWNGQVIGKDEFMQNS